MMAMGNNLEVAQAMTIATTIRKVQTPLMTAKTLEPVAAMQAEDMEGVTLAILEGRQRLPQLSSQPRHQGVIALGRH